jgi:hypothetical protein
VRVIDTLKGKLDPKTKDCIFLGYVEGVKASVFKHVATGQRFVLHDVVVESVRFNSEPIAGGSLGYQGKKGTSEVNPEPSEEDPYEVESRSPVTRGSSTYTQEHDDDPLMGYEGILARRPRQPHVRFMHK